MRRTTLFQLVFVLLSVAVVCFVLAAPVWAETPTPAVPAAGEGASAPVSLDLAHLVWLLIITLAFALLALAAVFRYTYLIQRRFYEASEGLGRAGRSVQVTSVGAFVPASGLEGLEEGAPAAVQSPMQITGPAAVTVGIESHEYSASWAEGSAPAGDAVWAVDPPSAAVVNPQKGAKVRVIAAVAGVFKLIATVSTDKKGQAKFSVAAVALPANSVQLPFVGQSYGSIVIAIILIAAIIVLGLGGVLSGEGVATLLGGLLGYIFGVARPAAAEPGNGRQSNE